MFIADEKIALGVLGFLVGTGGFEKQLKFCAHFRVFDPGGAVVVVLD